jgi:benzil reductase ((S)-benzoin forming)
MKYAIITGTSRGLGEAVAKLLMTNHVHVDGISRKQSPILKQIASENNVTFQEINCDLGKIEELETLVQLAFKQIIRKEASELYLINNAAVIEPIEQGMNISPQALAYHFQVNAVAPMVLTNLFLKQANNIDIPVVSLTVTSGAAEKPTYGWSAYCSSKASINMYTKTIALEQEHLGTNHKVIAFSPGVMDTAMQEEIRSSSKTSFTSVGKFRAYKENNQLRDTEKIGKLVVQILLSKNIVNGKIYEAKDYLLPQES